MTASVYCDHPRGRRSPRFKFARVTEEGGASPEIVEQRGGVRSFVFACGVCPANYRFPEARLLPALARLRELGQREISVQNLQRAISQQGGGGGERRRGTDADYEASAASYAAEPPRADEVLSSEIRRNDCAQPDEG